ncbi:circularly permuted type 2 ATP-grasp protein [Pseudorhodobacter ferrugineus]|uniref:circularly permuted type 2 ATP-grasp protein n=1 Tax=Pseudorhodobacter ferrugineus TaxID=77008 RepID=UPI0003B338DE|nr:circularly permuted type 2 ATP-grasp protein [Pseudorhodobacter ferrugineus]
MQTKPLAPADPIAAYAQRAGGRDEMLDAQGNVKPVWAPFIAHFCGLSPDDVTKRFARGDQYLRDAGVLYRQYDDTVSTEREWPLSHIPVILQEQEWAEIAAGLTQRADLLELVLRDLYGENKLVASGQLPATLLAQNPAWLRPLVGVKPAAKNYLNLLSFEIGRGPDNKWWVISDLVEAPSTAGFALENRVAMTRVFPNHFAGADIHRLAGFFQSFQKTLFEMRGKAGGEIAILSPGQMHQNHAEHAYIARYLGLLLVEGEDLIVQNGRALVRTVAGPKPVTLLWNRLPGALCDPLELDPASLLGTPGLLDALRAQSVKMVNALGSGVLETRALMAFLPKIARKLLGEPLIMPNIATWWCGQPSARDYVMANSPRMMIGSAFSTLPLMASTNVPIDAAQLEHSGAQLVGQESVTLSTTPTYENGSLVPRPLSLRIFMARTRDGWQVMPGGYARVSAGHDAKAFAMQRGGKVADVWVVSGQPVPKSSLIGTTTQREATTRALPSRAADNLFWLGRYVERAERNMRLYRAYVARINDGTAPDAPDAPLPRLLRSMMNDAIPADMAKGFSAPLTHAHRAAAKIGDRFSPDGMMALRDLVSLSNSFHTRTLSPEDLPREISTLLRQIAGFAGLVHENMYNSDGWRFLSLGMSLERASSMASTLAYLTTPTAPDGALDLALELGDSVITHRNRFSIFADPASVLDLLALDDQNPRALRYHITRARRHIAQLPGDQNTHRLTAVARQVLTLETRLATASVTDLTPDALLEIERDIWALAESLTAAHLV